MSKESVPLSDSPPFKPNLINMMTIFRMVKARKHFSNDAEIRILDIGCGNHSPAIAKAFFPRSTYCAVDRVKDYNNTEEDMAKIDEFYMKDLSAVDFTDIPDRSFDLIILSHVIEHLPNGDEIIEKQIPKLKKNGIIYIEYPGMRSAKMNNNIFFTNFFADPSHVRMFSLKEVYNILLMGKGGTMKFVEGGTKRNYPAILTIPLQIAYYLIRYRNVRCGDLADMFGFSEYCIFERTD